MAFWYSGWRPWALAVSMYMLWCVGLAYGGGRDLNWDALNYHLYVPSLLHRPLDQDFMGASVQSYLNPVSLLPFYGMVSAGWSALVVMLVLALIHSLNLVLLHIITGALLPRELPGRWAWCVAGALLGGSAALFWIELGTSFNDVICSLPVLAALACYAKAPHVARTGWATGAFMGVAIGLKLTALPWFAAMGLIWMMDGRADRWLQAARFGLGGALGFLFVDGFWALRLFQEFGNPFFPFFNEIFRSPLSAPEPFVHQRFMPSSWSALLTFPWRAAQAGTMVYTETMAIDFRPAMLVVVGGALLIKVLAGGDRRLPRDEGRTLLLLLAGLLFYYVFWIMMSGNGRYAIAWLLMLGPVLVACWLRLRRGIRWGTYGVATMLGLQVSSNAAGAVERWASTAWPQQWFAPSVPAEWKTRPHLFLSLEKQTYSFLAHFVHADSSFVNLVGQLPVRPDGPEWSRVSALLQRHAGHVLTLMPPAALGADQAPVAWDTDRQRALLSIYGLTIESDSCRTVVIDPTSDHPAVVNPSLAWQGLTDTGLVVSCAARPFSPEERAASYWDFARLKKADKVFDYLERACPTLTKKRTAVTAFNGHSYRRFYLGTDVFVILRAHDGRLTWADYKRYPHELAPACVDASALAEFRAFSKAGPPQDR